jgi:uncharacterized protein
MIEKDKLEFKTWHVSFSQDCNLRCSYCSTGFGRKGMKTRIMSKPVWTDMAKFAFSHVTDSGEISFEFGNGETFLHFDNFLHMADHLRVCAKDQGVSANIHITTNGTLLNEGRMEQLAMRGISLTFSIDGPQPIHDFSRKDKEGHATYERAIKAWQFYRRLSIDGKQGSACSVQSVISRHSNLLELIKFWSSLDQNIFKAVVQLPSRFMKRDSVEDWRSRQNTYLKDFEFWAKDQAMRLNSLRFFSDYYGPADLLMLWETFFWNRRTYPCGVGQDIIAVDGDGNLYPCEAFIGVSKWRIGNIFSGILQDKLNVFLKAKRNALMHCQKCQANSYCGRCCFGRNPEGEIVDNFLEGCWFAKRLIDIAMQNYDIIMGRKK